MKETPQVEQQARFPTHLSAIATIKKKKKKNRLLQTKAKQL